MIMTATYTVDGKEKMFKYEDDPLFLNIITAIETIANAVVNEGKYRPYLLKYMTELNIVGSFTDIKLPEDINDCYAFLRESDIGSILRTKMPDTYAFIEDSVEELVDFNKESAIKRTKIDDLLDALLHLIGTLNSEFEGLDMNDVLTRMEKVGFLPNMNENEIATAILNQIAKEEKEKEEKENESAPSDSSDKIVEMPKANE